jgi:hypothetical protein
MLLFPQHNQSLSSFSGFEAYLSTSSIESPESMSSNSASDYTKTRTIEELEKQDNMTKIIGRK